MQKRKSERKKKQIKESEVPSANESEGSGEGGSERDQESQTTGGAASCPAPTPLEHGISHEAESAEHVTMRSGGAYLSTAHQGALSHVADQSLSVLHQGLDESSTAASLLPVGSRQPLGGQLPEGQMLVQIPSSTWLLFQQQVAELQRQEANKLAESQRLQRWGAERFAEKIAERQRQRAERLQLSPRQHDQAPISLASVPTSLASALNPHTSVTYIELSDDSSSDAEQSRTAVDLAPPARKPKTATGMSSAVSSASTRGGGVKQVQIAPQAEQGPHQKREHWKVQHTDSLAFPKQRTELFVRPQPKPQPKARSATHHSHIPKSPTATAPVQRGIWRCPNCGAREREHNIITCSLPRRSDLSPSLSVEEQEYLKYIDILRRGQRSLQRQIKSEEEDNEEGARKPDLEEPVSSSEGEDIVSDSERSESESPEEEDEDFIESESSYRRSSASASGVSSLSRDSSRATSTSVTKEARRATKHSQRNEQRLDRIEGLLETFIQAQLGGQASKFAKASSPSHSPDQEDQRQSSSPTQSQRAAYAWSRGAPSLPRRIQAEGMVGCPEVTRQDLLSLSKFEALEKKYADYCDKASTWKRRAQPIASCFHKFLPDIVMSINSLLSRNGAVRGKFENLLRKVNYRVSQEFLLEMSTRNFSDLYKEVITARTSLASELIAQLIDTEFQRTSTPDCEVNTLTSLVIQASTAFRVNLESMPTQTVAKCTDIQLRNAFVKMVLGNSEAHLADFSECPTWESAVEVMLDMESSGQGVTLLKLAQSVKQAKHLKAHDSPKARQQDLDTRGDREDADWKAKYHELAAKVPHTEADMRGQESWRKKAKRLMQIRDERARDLEIQAFEKGDKRNRHGQNAHSRDRQTDDRSSRPENTRQWNPKFLQERNQRVDTHDQNVKSSRESSTERSQPAQDQSARHPQREHNADNSSSRSQLGTAPPTRSRETVCYNCRGTGHLAKDCPKIGAGADRSNSPRRAQSPGGKKA
jgi:hypothetical protein